MSRTAKQKILEGDAKMAKKFNFLSPSCLNCQYRLVMGNLSSETRYCTGFKKKKARRFRSSDPQIKPPKWCPRRLSPTICRIYGLKDTNSELMEFMLRNEVGIIHPSPHHYKLRTEIPLGMTAKEFFSETEKEYLKNILPPQVEVKAGEIIEIDDGFRPYCFYVDSFASVTPLAAFEMRKSKQDSSGEGGF